MKKWWKAEIDGRAYAGRLTPYNLIIIGVCFILNTPISTKNIPYAEGDLIKYNYTETSLYLYIDTGKDRPQEIKVGVKPYRQQLRPLLPHVKYVKVWVNKKYNTLKQMETDGQMIIPYSWWVHTRVFWCFVGIGLLILPFTERSFRKWRQEEKDKELIEEKQEQTLYQKREQTVEAILLPFGMRVKPCTFLDFSDIDRYSYYLTVNNALSQKNICVRFKHKKDTFPLELIYYSRLPDKTGDATLNTVNEYCYQVSRSFTDISQLSCKTTQYQYDSIPLKRRLDGHYRYFMESPS